MANTQGRYVKTTLSEGEKIVEAFPEHWIKKIEYYFWYLVALCCLSLWVLVFIPDIITIRWLPGWLSYWLFLPVGLCLFFIAAYQHIEFNFREFVLTNKRFVFKRGIIGVTTQEQILNKTDTVELNQTVLGRILGYATIKLTTTGNSDLLLNDLSSPRKVKTSIEEVL